VTNTDRAMIFIVAPCFDLGRRPRQCGSIAAMPTIEFVVPLFDKQDSVQNFCKLPDELPLPQRYSLRYIYGNDGSLDET
jgi:hypothetical protein